MGTPNSNNYNDHRISSDYAGLSGFRVTYPRDNYWQAANIPRKCSIIRLGGYWARRGGSRRRLEARDVRPCLEGRSRGGSRRRSRRITRRDCVPHCETHLGGRLEGGIAHLGGRTRARSCDGSELPCSGAHHVGSSSCDRKHHIASKLEHDGDRSRGGRSDRGDGGLTPCAPLAALGIVSPAYTTQNLFPVAVRHATGCPCACGCRATAPRADLARSPKSPIRASKRQPGAFSDRPLLAS